jgi:hypothetical protein
MSEIPLEQPSALNLTLQGSCGRFQVGSGSVNSLEVRYFLTNVGLALGQGPNDHLLNELAPVREVFRTDELGFDELMQRDIDDARVTSELIPYLLDYETAGIVKLFPPIIVMILPKAPGEDRPLRFYPSMSTNTEPRQGHEVEVLRIGEPGAELLTLEQPLMHGHPIDHDRVRLHLNTQATRLVIVDGQHRAMALLAIFRNLQGQWSDARRAPYKDFYAEWTPKVIGDFQLARVQLPMMLCIVPELNVAAEPEFDLIRAARRVFLTLNKTARKVSVARNRLLDDSDMIAAFMRSTLEDIKSREPGPGSRLRLWGLELDQTVDRIRIQSPTALSGVGHIYYVIEHLMLSNEDVRGLRSRVGRFAARRDLSNCLRRLDGRNLIGDDTANKIRRDFYPVESERTLSEAFMSRYGRYLIAMFDLFGPFSIHNEAVNSVGEELRDSDNRVHSLLFGSQGSLAVFESHRDHLKGREDQDAIANLIASVTETEKRLEKARTEMRSRRADVFLTRAISASEGSLRATVSDLYKNYFTTVATQAALLSTFFGEVEIANRTPGNSVDLDSEFTTYIDCLSRFFAPSSKDGLEGLIRVFAGEIAPTSEDPWRIIPTGLFRRVVFHQEMQPDQWPKLRYLLLELWEPVNGVLKAQLDGEVTSCREEVVKALFSRLRAQEASALLIPEDELSQEQLRELAQRCSDSVDALLANLQAHRPFDKQVAKEWAAGPPGAGEADDDGVYSSEDEA